ncbi:ABC transporter ATP-binding protein [Geosporobacter ferrireducens]|uniref:ABC transporter ATP-binding protein n=1 Tax=Geosporobacter ferrireducens TaxID=1424294 RepID=UPI00139BAB28|nr:ABC transporter ATP-binding protein [Geosporobacter ferrireducens]MTI56153.1 ABC transporter ATP-binding protein [Geosporobacter ferrireducens]
MVINYNKHRRAIEKLYEDICTISRYEKVKDPVTKETKLELKEIHSDRPCRISQKVLGTNGQTEIQNKILYEIKLSIDPELDIRQGDEILAAKRGITKKYQAGEPFPPYPTHQEIILQRKDNA